jgi:hypothetical protein
MGVRPGLTETKKPPMFDLRLQPALVTADGFPWWLLVTHLVNFLLLGLLVRSGWEILASQSHPPGHGCED